MDKRKTLIIELTNSGFNGPSVNGPPMFATITALDFEEAINTNTYENYTAWGILLHCMYWKHYLIKNWGNNPRPFPYSGEDFPELPVEKSEAQWKKTIEHSQQFHEEYINTLTNIEDEKLDEIFPLWKCTYIQACAGMATHETYHVAQIRNMGLKIKDK